jgi:hypothetical protein
MPRLLTLMILVAVTAVGMFVVKRLVVGISRTEAIALASACVQARDPSFRREDHLPSADLAVYDSKERFPFHRYYWLVEFRKGGIITHFVTVDQITGRCGEWNDYAEYAE